ncbi:hypothetical protein TNCV_5022801 [Trichonephila clavipes]|nr:hypothetical protein TNCV_5022801 [Trichonephila clavipes]
MQVATALPRRYKTYSLEFRCDEQQSQFKRVLSRKTNSITTGPLKNFSDSINISALYSDPSLYPSSHFSERLACAKSNHSTTTSIVVRFAGSLKFLIGGAAIEKRYWKLKRKGTNMGEREDMGK